MVGLTLSLVTKHLFSEGVFRSNDEDIITQDTLELATSTSYTSSPTFTSSSVWFQSIAMHRNGDISHMKASE